MTFNNGRKQVSSLRQMESFISLLSKRNLDMMPLLSINIVTHYLKQNKLYIKR